MQTHGRLGVFIRHWPIESMRTNGKTYQNETAGIIKDARCLLSPGEKPIPGGLLPSRAHFRFGSQYKFQNTILYLQPAKFPDHFLLGVIPESLTVTQRIIKYKGCFEN